MKRSELDTETVYAWRDYPRAPARRVKVINPTILHTHYHDDLPHIFRPAATRTRTGSNWNGTTGLLIQFLDDKGEPTGSQQLTDPRRITMPWDQHEQAQAEADAAAARARQEREDYNAARRAEAEQIAALLDQLHPHPRRIPIDSTARSQRVPNTMLIELLQAALAQRDAQILAPVGVDNLSSTR